MEVASGRYPDISRVARVLAYATAIGLTLGIQRAQFLISLVEWEAIGSKEAGKRNDTAYRAVISAWEAAA